MLFCVPCCAVLCRVSRRQWSLVDTDHMRYCQLGAWDKAMQELDDKYGFLSAQHQWVTHIDNERKVRRTPGCDTGGLSCNCSCVWNC